MAKSYCYKCGEKFNRYWDGDYNQDTGGKSIKLRCENKKCFIGCSNTTGHTSTNHWVVQNNCTTCGAIYYRAGYDNAAHWGNYNG